jgi:hypothetical protein
MAGNSEERCAASYLESPICLEFFEEKLTNAARVAARIAFGVTPRYHAIPIAGPSVAYAGYVPRLAC